MMIIIYIANILLLLPVVFSDDINDYTSLREQCPTPDYNQNCQCPDPITGETSCPEGEKCCYMNCGYECVQQVPGCPNWGQISDPSICNNECPEGEACCFNGCDYACETTVLTCPMSEYMPCEDCHSSYICPPGLMCCYDGCKQACLEPIYYNLKCPNDSILEHRDQWTTFCLSNCNCPDYMLCCDGPCDCDVDVCRTPVVETATCPGLCFEHSGIPCENSNDCFWNNQLCCDCIDGKFCTNPELGPGPPYYPYYGGGPIFFK